MQMDEKFNEESLLKSEKQIEPQNGEDIVDSQAMTELKIMSAIESQKTVSVTSQTDPEAQELKTDEDKKKEQTSDSISLPSSQSESQSPSQQQQQTQSLPQSQPQLEHTRRIIVKHSILGNKIASHDPNVLVESTTFTSLGKIQPFLITISTNAALIMDYHCHLTTSEVVGYLAGSWDINTHSLTITHAFPCKCRLGDYESAPTIESEIRKTIKSNNITVVGWYHSHPTAPPTPTIRDIESQLDYELRMKGTNDSSYLPCIGFICSPYNLDNPTLESNIVSYWVVPPPENKIHEYGKPMMMSYSVLQDQTIPREVLLEMKNCADFYKPEKDYIKFKEIMKGSVTFLEKLKVSLTPKFPFNYQKSDSLWAFIRDITESSFEKSEIEILQQVVEISSTPSAILQSQQPPPLPLSSASEKPKFNKPNVASSLSPINYKATPNSVPPPPPPLPSPTASYKAHTRTKSFSSKRSNSRDGNKNLASLSNYFVGSDLANLFNSAKFSNLVLDPTTKSLLNLNSWSLGGMFLPPMAAAAAAAAAASYKPDSTVGLMKPPPPPPSSSSSSGSCYPYSSGRSSSGSRSNLSSTLSVSSSTTSPSSSRTQSRSIPSTSRDMPPPPPNKVPKLDVRQMTNFFIPSNLSKNCTITSRSSGSTSANK